ncbi:hypothetical protein SAMN05421852_104100 [Thermoflavimicrobium dichotomicum]|uniref:Uncharacterized protein n=1 Tax=Thermoflavimicrobium dichotomicum TaxID=46223 RepID=A0A1I3NDY2_9BACL|nr:hypothetical protein SAMN05421852_104100 [Thermoflavimicrobium dichotomicum]
MHMKTKKKNENNCKKGRFLKEKIEMTYIPVNKQKRVGGLVGCRELYYRFVSGGYRQSGE